MSNEELYLSKLKQDLNSINDKFEYNITWNHQFIHSELNPIGNKNHNVLIVITELPSEVYDEGDTNLSLSLELECLQEDANEVISVLKTYQSIVYNQKRFIDNILISESYTSPQIIDTFEEIETSYYVRMQMTGSVAFTKNIVDIEGVYYNDKKVKALYFHDNSTAEISVVSLMNTYVKKSKNRSILYSFEIKTLSANNDLCNIARNWKYGLIPPSSSIPIKIKYTDGFEVNRDMLFEAVDYQTEESGSLPVMVLSLKERLNN